MSDFIPNVIMDQHEVERSTRPIPEALFRTLGCGGISTQFSADGAYLLITYGSRIGVTGCTMHRLTQSDTTTIWCSTEAYPSGIKDACLITGSRLVILDNESWVTLWSFEKAVFRGKTLDITKRPWNKISASDTTLVTVDGPFMEAWDLDTSSSKFSRLWGSPITSLCILGTVQHYIAATTTQETSSICIIDKRGGNDLELSVPRLPSDNHSPSDSHFPSDTCSPSSTPHPPDVLRSFGTKVQIAGHESFLALTGSVCLYWTFEQQHGWRHHRLLQRGDAVGFDRQVLKISAGAVSQSGHRVALAYLYCGPGSLYDGKAGIIILTKGAEGWIMRHNYTDIGREQGHIAWSAEEQLLSKQETSNFGLIDIKSKPSSVETTG